MIAGEMIQATIRSVYDQAYEVLRQRVDSQAEENVLRLPPEPQLAKELGVSRDMIRRVLAQMARERLIDRHHGRGTFIRPRPRLPTICALVHGDPAEMFDPVKAVLMRGASLQVQEMPEKVSIRFEQLPEWGGPGIAERLVREVRSLRSDGYLVGLALRLKDCLAVLAAHVPLVMLPINYGPEGVPCVAVDHHAGGVMAGRYLREKGRRRVAMVCWPSDEERRLSKAFLGGLIETLGESAPRAGETLIMTDTNAAECTDAVARLLGAQTPPDAIVTTGDSRTHWVLAALRDRGLDGLDSPELLPYVNTPETAPGTYVQLYQGEERGREAVRMLWKLMEGEALEQTVKYFSPRLVVR